jgi:FkbM family methyltransferase
MAFGLFELDTARWLRRVLRPGDHVVDGGANIGYFSLMVAQIVGPTGRVDAFEPQPDNLARLQSNILRNNLADRIQIHPEALSDQPGQMMIHSYGDPDHNHGCSSLFPEPGAKTIATPVATVRMDQAIAGTRPRLIKLDLQGAEPLAISGAAGLLLGDQPPMIVTAYEPSCARTAGFEPRELVDRILTIQPNYQVFNITRSLRRIDPTDDVLNSLMGIGGQVNLLFQAPIL